MLKTKIVCTLGPATDPPEVIRKIILEGMDVARINFSHGQHSEHLERVTQLREAANELGRDVAVLMDTKGPEIRLGTFPEGELTLEEGQSYIITTDEVECNSERACVSYKDLTKDVSPGDMILIDDGLIALEVQTINAPEIKCVVINSGLVSSRKGVNVPNVKIGLPSITEQDRLDIIFAIEHNFDFIAVSFVRKKEDIAMIQRILSENGGDGIKLIAKIESREGLDNLDEIIKVSDGVMVARGDLGVEIPMQEIPSVQKMMIEKCNRAGKPVITATQMLDSMIRNPRPTRAEVTDVANAIYDGTSAIMLSGETAAGKYPVDSVRTMVSVAQTTEDSIDYWERFRVRRMRGENSSITNAISHATCTTAMDLGVAAIIAVTTSGRTAQAISMYRPKTPIITATTNERVKRQLKMVWGVIPMLAERVENTDKIFDMAVRIALDSGLVKDGALVVITAGVPLSTSGTTNMLKVQLVGDVLCRGEALSVGQYTGTVFVLPRDGEAQSFTPGSVLVLDEITDEALPLMRLAGAVVLDGMDKNDKALTLAKALEIPFLVNADGAIALLRSGTVVKIDAEKGIVSRAGAGS